jgi:hypothetical protein
MNALLDFTGSLLYLAFMIFLLPILAVLYTILSVWRTTVFLHHSMRQLPNLFISLHLERTLVPARRGLELVRRLTGIHAS